jgi:hypothetical protein
MWPGLYSMDETLGFTKHGQSQFQLFKLLKGTNVLRSRASTEIQVSSFSGGRQKGYTSLEDANAVWDHACTAGSVGPPPPQVSTPSCTPYRPLTSTLVITDEEAHWVVNKGRFPGVYLGK